jgi:hypothetical protein
MADGRPPWPAAAARDAVLATIAETRGVLDARAASWPETM